MNTLKQTPFVAYVGIDWADTKHDICLQSAPDTRREFSCITHQVERIDEWARSLHRRFRGPIAVALELDKGPIVYALQKYDFFVLFPINPFTLAKYREAFQPSRAKDDPTDAELALDLILHHPERFKPLTPQSTTIRTLLTLVERRRVLVQDRVRITNRLRYTLKQYYPQTLDWFNQVNTPLFCHFILRWPTLSQAKRVRRSTLERFFHEHNMHFGHIIEQRFNAIKAAQPLTQDNAVIEPHKLYAIVLVEQLQVLLQAIDRYDDEIAELASTHPDYELFSLLPGAGNALAPRLLVAFGEQRERFKNASELQRYSGIAPVTERSGQKHWVHWRWQSPTFLRQTFVEWAAKTIDKSLWAGAYYQQQRNKGCHHQMALRALAFKWIRILYRCWKNRTPYDEVVYLKSLKARGSTLFDTATITS